MDLFVDGNKVTLIKGRPGEELVHLGLNEIVEFVFEVRSAHIFIPELEGNQILQFQSFLHFLGLLVLLHMKICLVEVAVKPSGISLKMPLATMAH